MESARLVNIPNSISILRLALVPVFGLLIFAEQDVAAIAVLAVAGATDWLDGVLARRLGQVTEFGRLLDPAADRLYIAVTLVGLAARGFIPWWIFIAIVARELVIIGCLLLLRSRGFGFLQVHLAGKAATFALMYAFPLLLLGSFEGTLGYVSTVVGWAFALWGVALYWVAAIIYVVQTWESLRDKGTSE